MIRYIQVLIGVFVLPAVCVADDLHIGMAKSFFTDRPKVFVDIVSRDFTDVMKKTTGLNGQLNTAFGPYELGQAMKDRKLDFAIFHGHEFASVRKKFTDLQPLLIVANKHGEKAYLIVHRDSNAQSIADLRGKKAALPAGARGHCRAFLDKQGADFMVVNSASQIEALNDVASGKVDAAIVDGVGLAFFKGVRGPVFDKNLRILLASEPFPSPVIVYQRGALEEKAVNQFRDGLLKVQTTQMGQQLMRDWNIDSYDAVPKDYEKNLNETLKAYPLTQP